MPIQHRIEEWRRKLIDLSRRNRLLHFRPSKSAHLTITLPDSATIIDRLILKDKSWKFLIPPEDGEAEELFLNHEITFKREDELVCGKRTRVELEKILKNLYRRSSSDFHERGVRILYITFGMLHWCEQKDDPVASPILLIPVEIKRETARDPYVLSPVGEDVIVNPALKAKLWKDFNVSLKDLPEEWDESSLSVYFSDLRQVVAPLQWTIEPATVIGLFSFHKLVMYQDLDENAGIIEQHEVLRALAEPENSNLSTIDIPNERELDTVVEPIETYQVLDADSSQQQCIQAVLRGSHLVMQGPPGTGKSQTIANLIADLLAHGKTVLFVSEKMAALEVVFRRLKDVGIADLCLELHSHKANKAQVVEELKRCLEENIRPRSSNKNNEYEKLKKYRTQLNGYVQGLHELREPLGESIYAIIGKLSALSKVPLVSSKLNKVEVLRPSRVHEWEELIKRLCTVWRIVEEADQFPWRGCSISHWNHEIKSDWLSNLELAQTLIVEVQARMQAISHDLFIAEPKTPEATDRILQLARHIFHFVPVPQAWLGNYSQFNKLEHSVRTLQHEYEQYQLAYDKLSATYTDTFFTQRPTLQDFQKAWIRCTAFVLPEMKDSTNFVARRHDILSFGKNAIHEIDEILSSSRQIASELTLDSDIGTLGGAMDLAQLVDELSSEELPLPDWLSASTRWSIRKELELARSPFGEYCKLRDTLLQKYDEDFLNLQVDDLVDRFGGFIYKSLLRFVSPRFYRDRKCIERLTKAKQFPSNTLDDLLEAQRILKLKKRLEPQLRSLEAYLGRWFNGFDTNFAQIDTLLVKAERLGKLYNGATRHGIIGLLSLESSIDLSVRQCALRIRTSYKKLDDGVNEWTGTLSRMKEPNPQGLLLNAAILSIREHMESLCAGMEQLCRQIDGLVQFHKTSGENCVGTMVSHLELAEQMTVRLESVTLLSDKLAKEFGGPFQGISTPWAELSKQIAWARTFFNFFPTEPPSTELVSRIAQSTPPLDPEPAILALTQLNQALGSIFSAFEQDRLILGWRRSELKDLRELCTQLSSRIDDLEFWIEFKKLKIACSNAGLEGFLNQLEHQRPPAGQLLPILQRSVFQAWFDKMVELDPRLQQFRGEYHDQVIEEFADLDRRLVHLSADRVIERYNERKPSPLYVQTRDSEIGLLRRESAKKRRLLPLRKLFGNIPNVLLRLKPCALMSPLSVSQYMHPDQIKFDVVIFDEASQIFTEDAVVAMYRAKQVVVVGDSKQLPPTDFFRTLEDDDGEVEDDSLVTSSGDYKSVLDECGTVLPNLSLRWHYRSRHESLIAFSNHRFYQDRLITFPSAQDKHEELGLELKFIAEGVYDRGGQRNNLLEARAVADHVLAHFRNYPRKSIGVVAFSQAQMNAIEDELEQRRRNDPSYESFFISDRLDGFFVKNLENVQGDERDVIIFSVGYGYDQNRRITMNFGPLNKPGGEHRLNVAITRAREKVILISSIKASDIDLGATDSAGVLNLYHYLDYAERGVQALATTLSSKAEYESPLEEDIAGEIRNLGYNVMPQVGCSGYRIDLAIIDPTEPGRFLLGVECDGATYHSAATARDRDRLRQQVLENQGWRVHRIWGPNWVRNRSHELKTLTDIINAARALPSSINQAPSFELTPERFRKKEHVPLDTTEPLPWTIAYAITKLGTPPAKHRDFYDSKSLAYQSKLIQDIVSTEGPVHIDVVARRVAGAWELRRTGSAILEVIEKAVQSGVRSGAIAKMGSFLWPTKMVPIRYESILVRIPVPGVDETYRDVDEVAPEEIQRAMLLIIQHAIGIKSDALLSETARLLGFQRTGGRIRKSISKNLRSLEVLGLIKRDGDSVRMGTRE